jgi:5-methylcytosine-specific restriction endonuclease McrA
MNRKRKIRDNFRTQVFKRDNYTCVRCNTKRSESLLNAHHIADRSKMPNGGYVKENGVTLCEQDCHMAAEKFHISGGLEWENGLHPDDLYSMIGSSYEIAVKQSEKLK